MALLALGGYALLGELPKPRWVVPAALLVLVVEAYRTAPAEIDDGSYQFLAVAPDGYSAPAAMLTDGLALTWAALAVSLLLLGAGRRWPVAYHQPVPRRGPVVTGTVLAVLLLTADPAVRLSEIALDLSAGERSTSASSNPVWAAVVRAGSVMLAPLVLAGRDLPHRRTVPLPALAAAIELAAYVLLAVGLTHASTGRRGKTATNSPN